MATPETIINQALAVAADKANLADGFAQGAISASQGYSYVQPNVIGATKPAGLEPAVHIPSQAAGVDSALYQSTYDTIVGDLGQKFADFFAEYFPEDSDYVAAAQAWIHRALTEGGTGVNPAVEGAVYLRDTQRVRDAAQQAMDAINSHFASRGFPMPPGSLGDAVTQIQKELFKEEAASSRQQAITSMELEVENVRLAVNKAMDYRTSAIQAAGDYIKTMALGPQIASNMATSAAGAQAQLISAASSYYNARISLHSIIDRSQHSDADRLANAGTSNSGNFMQGVGIRAQTAAAVAASMGQQAAAALNAVNATAQIITHTDS